MNAPAIRLIADGIDIMQRVAPLDGARFVRRSRANVLQKT